MKILLIDDDSVLVEMVRQTLVNHQYAVDVAIDGQEGWDFAESFEYDLILLDWMLPKLDGVSFCKQLRSGGQRSLRSPNYHTPILLMTAQDAVTQKVVGLDAGADDYLVKPFSLDELLARMRALLRRRTPERSPQLSWGALQLNPKTGEVFCANKRLYLTVKEYQLLELFLRNPGRIFSHGALTEHLWSLEEAPTENAIRAQIKGLRKKLKESGTDDLIETIYGFGYRLKEVDANSTATQETQKASSRRSINPAVLLITPQVIWEQSRQSYCDRLSIIEQAGSELQKQTLSSELQRRAYQEAHTLKGSLGLFGLDEAVEFAGEIEQLFEVSDSLTQAQIEHLTRQVAALRQLLDQPLQAVPSQVDEKSTALSNPPEDELNAQRSEFSNQDRTPDQIHNSLDQNNDPLIVAESIPLSSSESSIQSTLKFQLLLVEDDELLTAQIQQVAIAHNLHVTIATNLTEARLTLQQFQPDVVLLDLNLSATQESGLDLLTELSCRHPQIPVIVWTAQEEWIDRVRVAKLGAKGFLQKPIAAKEVIRAIARVLHHRAESAAKVLIVDDDPQICAYLHTLLAPWGLQTTSLHDPHQFWTILKQVKPDLLVLDIEMPDLCGVDLCQVVRNDLEWGNLPILMLSSHTNEATIQQVFLAGADDYVSKPIRPAELVARILGRLERHQIQRLSPQ